MGRLKDIYHRSVPAGVRFPIGRLRRTLMDQGLRLSGKHGPLPPRHVLKKVQMTPWAMEYLEVGRRSAETIRRVLAEAGVRAEASHKVLDFGCGLARTLRHLTSTAWDLWGSDVDEDSVVWSQRAVPEVQFEANGVDPPLPFDSEFFDAVYAISVFTHFSTDHQHRWAEELARVLRPGGIAVVTTMGPWAFDPLPPEAQAPLPGFWFVPVSGAFNNSAAIHTEDGLEHFFHPDFEKESWTRGGLDGFQDLGVFRRRS